MKEAAVLFDANAPVGAPSDLFGGVCKACGYNFSPMQERGCEQCGSLELIAQRFQGRGRIATFAEVYVHQDPLLPPPFVIASIELDDGLAVRALVAADAAELSIGDLVEAKVFFNAEGAAPELRFVPQVVSGA